jgi:uncharacterized membrane protein SpoIIM required for sporulation
MKQQDFVSANEALWIQLESFLNYRKRSEIPEVELRQLPGNYRRVCHHLALAKHRRYSLVIIDRLNRIVVACHNLVYSQNVRFRYQWVRFFIDEFPGALQRNYKFMRVANLLFYGPAIVIGLLCYFDTDFVYSILPNEQVRMMEFMYSPEAKVLGRELESATDVYMFGYYIRNNIGIAFREFAGGVFFGLGTLFFVILNGVFLGAIFGHLTQVGYVSTLYPFVIGHGAFELTAIVIAGAAGLKLGGALIDPGSQTRLAALRAAGREAIPIILGATFMLFIAAVLEAFWSSKASLPIPVKLGVGAIFWTLVLYYINFVGRHQRHGP